MWPVRVSFQPAFTFLRQTSPARRGRRNRYGIPGEGVHMAKKKDPDVGQKPPKKPTDAADIVDRMLGKKKK
jgi:hypothetical protein